MAESTKITFSKLKKDLLTPPKEKALFAMWIATLGLVLLVAGVAYYIQLRDGLGTTAMSDFVSWGLYISHFVFCVAVSLVGMLISSIMGLLKIKWITPISRIAEFIAIGFVAVAGMVIIFDMGRPERLLNVFIHGRIQSPILWDLTVINTYLIISVLLLLLPMIPDMAIAKNHLKDASPIMKKVYSVLSFGYTNTPAQHKALHRLIRILMVLVVPVGLAIHTVTSWLFASTLRVGWDTTIFGPYFVTGAFVAGVAALIIAMAVFRVNYRLADYITDMHFDKVGKLLVLVSLVYLYFNINEYLVSGYKMKTGDAAHLDALFTGHWATMFWFTQITGLLLPIVLLLFKPMRKMWPLTIISGFVVLGAWLKRYIIVIPTMLHPHLPFPTDASVSDITYDPTWTEFAITMGTVAIALLIITILARMFPVVPIAEYAEHHNIPYSIEEGQHEDSTQSKEA